MPFISQEELNSNLPIFSKNDTFSVAALFEARKFFENNTVPFITGSYFETEALKTNIKQIPFGDLYKQNAFYGIIDNEGNIIVPKNIDKNLKTVNVYKKEPQKLQDFVADAFNDMNSYLKEMALIGNFSPESPYINLSIKKSFIDIQKLYIASFLLTAEKIKQRALSEKNFNSKITDIKSFNNEYVKFLKKHLPIMPVTRSAMTTYYNFKGFSSGLAFSFATEDSGDDINKYIKYFLDDSFICFAEACVRFGFKIDKNMPWVLYADLNSPAIKPYLEKYGLRNSDDVFKQRFKKTYADDLLHLKTAFFTSYDSFLLNNINFEESYSKLCSGNSSQNIIKKREPVNYSFFIKSFPDSYWLRIYVYFRNLETDTRLSQQQFENLVREANRPLKYGKIEEAMKYVNNKFDNFKNVSYFSSLQSNSSVLQEEKPFGTNLAEDIIL